MKKMTKIKMIGYDWIWKIERKGGLRQNLPTLNSREKGEGDEVIWLIAHTYHYLCIIIFYSYSYHKNSLYLIRPFLI